MILLVKHLEFGGNICIYPDLFIKPCKHTLDNRISIRDSYQKSNGKALPKVLSFGNSNFRKYWVLLDLLRSVSIFSGNYKNFSPTDLLNKTALLTDVF